MCLQEDLRRAGIAPDASAARADGTMADNVAALRRGTVDVVQVFEPFAAALVAEASAMSGMPRRAAGRPPTPRSMPARGLLAARRDELHRMVRAIHRTQKWVARRQRRRNRRGHCRLLPGHAGGDPAAACDRYKVARHLGRRLRVLPRAGYDRLRASLVSGGFVRD